MAGTPEINGDQILVGVPLDAPPKYRITVPGQPSITFSSLPLMLVFLQRESPKWTRHRVYSVLEGVDRASTKALLAGRRIDKISRA